MKKIKGLQFEAGEAPKILILGTMPGDQSIEKQEYYSSPNNSFWTIIEQVFNDGKPFASYNEKCACLHNNGIALWDVFDSCDREKSSDKTIKKPVYNDIEWFLEEFPISLIVFNGIKAEKAFNKHFHSDVKTVTAPSTSNAFPMSREKKIAAWSELLDLSKIDQLSSNNHQDQDAEKMNIRIEISGRGNVFNIVSPSSLERNEDWKDAIRPLVEKSEEEWEAIEGLDGFEEFSMEYMDDSSEMLLYTPEEKHPVYIKVIDTDSDDVIDQFTSDDIEPTDNNVTINGGYICRRAYVHAGQLAVDLYDVEYSRDNFSFNKVNVTLGEESFEGLEACYEYYDEEAEYDTEAMFDVEGYDEKDSYMYINLDGEMHVS